MLEQQAEPLGVIERARLGVGGDLAPGGGALGPLAAGGALSKRFTTDEVWPAPSSSRKRRGLIAGRACLALLFANGEVNKASRL